MIPGKIFTRFAKFQGIVSANDFRLPCRLQDFLQAPLCFLRSFCFTWVWLYPLGAKSCTTTAYRWLSRDSLSSLSSLWSAVIKSPKVSAFGTTVPARLMQEDLVIFVFKQISQFASFGKWEKILCLPKPGSTIARDSIGNSKEELALSWSLGAGFHRGSKGLLSLTKISLNSCSQSGKSCKRSLCTSSCPSFLILFSVSVGLCSRFSCSSSLVLPLLSDTGFSVYLLSSNTESRGRCRGTRR